MRWEVGSGYMSSPDGFSGRTGALAPCQLPASVLSLHRVREILCNYVDGAPRLRQWASAMADSAQELPANEACERGDFHKSM